MIYVLFILLFLWVSSRYQCAFFALAFAYFIMHKYDNINFNQIFRMCVKVYVCCAADNVDIVFIWTCACKLHSAKVRESRVFLNFLSSSIYCFEFEYRWRTVSATFCSVFFILYWLFMRTLVKKDCFLLLPQIHIYKKNSLKLIFLFVFQ